MRAATHVRVSTEEQAENGTSLDTQREQAAAYIKSRGWTIVQTFEDAGISGTKGRIGQRRSARADGRGA
jgi:site-specific DNA recombinase